MWVVYPTDFRKRTHRRGVEGDKIVTGTLGEMAACRLLEQTGHKVEWRGYASRKRAKYGFFCDLVTKEHVFEVKTTTRSYANFTRRSLDGLVEAADKNKKRPALALVWGYQLRDYGHFDTVFVIERVDIILNTQPFFARLETLGRKSVTVTRKWCEKFALPLYLNPGDLPDEEYRNASIGLFYRALLDWKPKVPMIRWQIMYNNFMDRVRVNTTPIELNETEYLGPFAAREALG